MVSVTFQVIFLLIIFVLRVSNGDLQYKCEAGEGNKVKITISKTTNNFTTQTMTVFEAKCKNSSDNSDFILKDCPAETDILIEFTNAEPKNVLRRKDVEVFMLNCHYKKKSVIKTVTAAPFKVTEPPTATRNVHNFQNTKWIPTLSMEVTPNSNSGIVIGETLTVKISSKAGQYTIAAQECKATSGTKANSLVLWNSMDCTSGDENLFGVDDWLISKLTSIDITHRLEAFRFTDSNTLQLECSVKICPQEMDSDCDLSCNKTPKKRRRRDVNSKTTVVKTTLNVVDSLQDFSNSGSGPFLATSLVSTAVIMYSMVL